MSGASDEGIRRAAEAWLAQDPDPSTRAELTELLAARDDPAAQAELRARFGSRLGFGTAGLRGALGAGSARMNRVLVAQAAAGLAAFLRERAGSGARPSVVIGYDGRTNSEVFARDSAELFAGAGLRAVLLPRTLPTPVLAFAVRRLGASAGVMVTASHNPPGDNGYKVYLGDADGGAQIVSPVDAQIAAHIDRVASSGPIGLLPRSTDYETAPEDVVTAYAVATAAVAPAPPAASRLRWAYTAMHGVGWETLAQVLDLAGYPRPEVVAEQLDPDPAFPTVSFPNPEEPGAMDRVIALARDTGAQLALANDPDADRLAVAIPEDGGWRRLTGNEVGLLLALRAARAATSAGAAAPGTSLACSLVSSPGLAAIAARYGLDSHETLTGFKWISRAPGMVYGYEEALGYLVNPETVRDKDGLSAAVAVLGLAAEAEGRGTTLGGLLTELNEEIGSFASAQISLRVDDVRTIAALMASLRADRPARIGASRVLRFDDLLDGVDALPPGDVLRLVLEGDARVIVRPSGTEPKLKAYLDVRGDSAAEAREALDVLEQDVRALLSARS